MQANRVGEVSPDIKRRARRAALSASQAPPNNSMEPIGQMRHVPCKKKSKGHAAFALQLMHGR